MVNSFKQIFVTRQSQLARAPERAAAKFQVTGRSAKGLHSKVNVRGFSVHVDEAEGIGGNDEAPNPVEYALAALAACQATTYRLYADALGIPVRDVSVTLEGEVDLRGLFSAAPGVRPGFQGIKGTVVFDSSASDEELEQLKRIVDAHCPVLDLFTNRTPVIMDTRRRAGLPKLGAVPA